MTEQKKLMVLGALFVAILAIGAFQFIPKGTPPAPVTTVDDSAVADGTEGEATEGDGEVVEGDGDGVGEGGVTTRNLVVNALGETVEPLVPRDPFKENGALKPLDAEPAQETKPPVTQTPPPTQNHRPAPLPSGGHGSEPVNPGGFPGFSLPATGPEIVPTEELEPDYLVKGVLVGARPIAVFEDGKGNQRLIPLGGSVDGDTTVVGIERGKVTIKRRGKEKTLVIQEEARND